MPPPPAALAAKVRTLAPSMTRSMQRVADALVADPAGTAALTVTALAERTGTSEATVVRTARILGYPGYRHLRLALAGLAASRRPAGPRAVTPDITVDDSAGPGRRQARPRGGALPGRHGRRPRHHGPGGGRGRARHGPPHRRLRHRRLPPRRQDLVQKLLRIGRIAHAPGDPHLAVTTAVQLRPGDVALAISHSGATTDVIEPLRPPSSTARPRSRSPAARTAGSDSTPITS
ncbi:hypothetical protein GCM10020221_05340 [Streptomyces thioluteus]|uniref:HTH rpiR-type domain-containing protein n=1 Tax=Streptomyces thioluteus TaxID=66431 RepID=A0ABP6IWZ9_STRTU